MNSINPDSNRKDGYAKVTGSATYAAEHLLPDLVYGALVTAPIAKGRIKAVDARVAAAMPGVLAIFTHLNAPRVHQPANNFFQSKIYEARLPLSDDQIFYAGQIVGLVIAKSAEQAREAAHQVQFDYEVQPPLIDPEQATFHPAPPFFGEDLNFQTSQDSTGDASAALATAPVRLEATYRTAMQIHAPMEPHAIIAHWQNDNEVTIYEPTQWVAGSQRTYADLFELPAEQVRIVTPYIGGSFGSKAFPWPHSILCAAAARQLQRPVKLVLSRRQMTANTGHRSPTEQVIQLGADTSGKLTAISHAVKSWTSAVDSYIESCTVVTPALYAAPNLSLKQDLAILNVGTPTFMRAPGECPGLWALESAMDELAWKLQIDPVELRLRNETQQHQRRGLPFSAKFFADCLRVGAAQFGWAERPPQPRSLDRDGRLIGWGMAAAAFPALQGRATARVRLQADGTVQVLTSGNDIGTGAYTIVAMTAAETLGLPLQRVQVEMGDSRLPDGGMAGGSQMTATLTPAVQMACQQVLQQAQASAGAEAIEFLQQSGQPVLEATATNSPGATAKPFTFHSWGAHFCEVAVDETIGRLQITRWVAVMNVGRVLNTKTATSQIRGGIIMGIGQALMEAVHLDPQQGYPVVSDLATYHIPSHADVPQIDVSFVGEPDLNFNPLGVRGIGEIGITGVAPAIANAIYHATGRRLRELPITPDQLLGEFWSSNP